MIWDVLPAAVGSTFQASLTRAMEERIAVEYEDTSLPPHRWSEARLFPVDDGIGCVFRDITDRKQTGMRTAAQYGVSRILSEANDLAEAAPRLLQEVCQGLGWELGSMWLVDQEAGVLRCIDSWHRPDGDLGRFADVGA